MTTLGITFKTRVKGGYGIPTCWRWIWSLPKKGTQTGQWAECKNSNIWITRFAVPSLSFQPISSPSLSPKYTRLTPVSTARLHPVPQHSDRVDRSDYLRAGVHLFPTSAYGCRATRDRPTYRCGHDGHRRQHFWCTTGAAQVLREYLQ